MRAIAALLLVVAANAVAAVAPQNAEREAETQARLEVLRAEIAELSKARAELSARRDEGVAALRAIDTQVSASARRLRELEAGIEAQNRLLAEREAERVQLQRTLGRSRATLANLLRSVYLIGRGESLKALLARDRISDSSRALAYYRYLQRDRLDRVQELLAELQVLLDVEKAIAATKATLAAERQKEHAQSAQLAADRVQREAVLAEFDAKLKEGETRLVALGRDEQDLLRLLEELRDIFADIPKQLEGNQPFASLKGRLRRPHAGSVNVAFGQSIATGRLSEGWLLGADAGDDVRAVAAGRVAFADWLKGFGLLLILDHGDGYMSLYAQNESLLKDVGDWVAAGDVVSTVGASGGAAQPGLYIELRHQGRPLDPKPWFGK
ncbi:MAG TPA: peptidoglycan DD-metalloendopeptidase family protein [Pseudomonadota bacterium]|nr:peptidoglycan DD-metalloendopeptidase family protein [Pseudomonadota bacterium]